MILKNTDIKHFIELMQNRDLICFGSGVFLDKFFSFCPMLVNQVNYIVDNNPDKWDSIREVNDQKKKIISPQKLLSVFNENSTILITANRVGVEILNQLNAINELKERDVFWSLFILAEVESARFLFARPIPQNFKLTKEPIIPKIIHYCWVGGNPIPKRLQEYIDGWKRLCPDYEIICWNEKNYDMEKNLYLKQAYEAKKWAFVSDYIRKDVLYENGGVYLDTDVEMIKRPDDLLYQTAFCGVEPTLGGKFRVNFGSGIGAQKELPILKELRDAYNDEQFEFHEKNMKIGPDFETEVLERHGFQNNGEYQIIAGITIYPFEILSSRGSYSDGLITNNTYMIHRNASSWNSEKSLELKKEAQRLYKSCERV